jgi:hypothetical protein
MDPTIQKAEEKFRYVSNDIREIRLSERRIYLKITDIFALASDYDKNSGIARHFSPLFKINCFLPNSCRNL